MRLDEEKAPGENNDGGIDIEKTRAVRRSTDWGRRTTTRCGSCAPGPGIDSGRTTENYNDRDGGRPDVGG